MLLKEIREETLFGANFLDSASELCNVIPLGEVISDLQKMKNTDYRIAMSTELGRRLLISFFGIINIRDRLFQELS